MGQRPNSDKPISRAEIREIEEKANQGKAHYQNEYGMMLVLGNYVPEDIEKAVEYFRKAAAQDHPEAIWNYACYLMKDPRGPLDKDKGLEVLTLACEKGIPYILNQLGYMYLHGIDVKRDEEKGQELLRRGADAGSPNAQFNLGTFYALKQDEELDALAFELVEKAAKADLSDAICVLGVFYIKGLGCEQDVDKGLELINLAVDQDNGIAMVVLGEFYESGEFFEQDYALARHYFGKAVSLGKLRAYAPMAKLLWKGLGGPKDLDAAFPLYQAALLGGISGIYQEYHAFMTEYAKSLEEAGRPLPDVSGRFST
ncbi:MAG: sel1 repeat family protein [Deltaproteobacteria bacterium]|jgi:TPR repeat protein|nr:sel1 repeat family protein [Deltaproteobacteria bacterium]